MTISNAQQHKCRYLPDFAAYRHSRYFDARWSSQKFIRVSSRGRDIARSNIEMRIAYRVSDLPPVITIAKGNARLSLNVHSRIIRFSRGNALTALKIIAMTNEADKFRPPKSFPPNLSLISHTPPPPYLLFLGVAGMRLFRSPRRPVRNFAG